MSEQTPPAGSIAYRRGLVVGFTIAELMVLLIFALFLIMAAALARSQGEIERLTEANAGLREAAKATVADTDLLRRLRKAFPQGLPTLEVLDRQLRVRPPPAWFEALTEPERSLARELTDWARSEGLKPETAKAAEALAREVKNGYRRSGTAPVPPSDYTPIIAMPEARGYVFDPGEARLSEAFKARVRSEVIPQILKQAQQYQTSVIEVVGHTDEVPVQRSQSTNLDDRLLDVLHGRARIDSLQVRDNVGLGMARAAAVAGLLIEDQSIRDNGYQVLPMSAGQTAYNDRLALGDDPGARPQRRRIEVRVRPPLKTDESPR